MPRRAVTVENLSFDNAGVQVSGSSHTATAEGDQTLAPNRHIGRWSELNLCFQSAPKMNWYKYVLLKWGTKWCLCFAAEMKSYGDKKSTVKTEAILCHYLFIFLWYICPALIHFANRCGWKHPSSYEFSWINYAQSKCFKRGQKGLQQLILSIQVVRTLAFYTSVQLQDKSANGT